MQIKPYVAVSLPEYRSFESVTELKSLRRTVTNQHWIQGLFIEHADMFKTGQNATER